jgi:hypothetical protein
VVVSVLFCSHAQCTQCGAWKKIASEDWSADNIAHARNHGNKLRCGSCANTATKTGQTMRDATLYKCAACKEEKGRLGFSKTHLDYKAKNTESLLVCQECGTQERIILHKLKAPEVWKCNKTCKPGNGHVQGCKAHPYWYGYARDPKFCVTRAELDFIHFREKHRKCH